MTMTRGTSGVGMAGNGESAFETGQEAWNIADGFTKMKILKPLLELDLFEMIALYGRKDIEENFPPEDLIGRRVEALDRILSTLRQVIGNVRFATEKRRDCYQIQSLMDRVEQVEQVLDGSAFRVVNDVTKEESIKINESHFRLCLTLLRGIKDELNFILNRNNMIFRHSDEVDLDKIMDDLVMGG